MPNYIYGLDLSMSSSGVCIMNLETKEIVYKGSIKTNDKESHGKRLSQIIKTLQSLKRQYEPYVICIEQGFSRHAKATQALFMVQGVALAIFHDNKVIHYAPTSIKKIITGNGKAEKSEVKNKIIEHFTHIDFDEDNGKDSDVSDAVAIAICYLIDREKIDWHVEEKPKTKSKNKKSPAK